MTRDVFPMRGGTFVDDERLGRLEQFDERSRDYGVMALVGASKPVSKTWVCPTFLDQGSEGACVAFAFAHELIAEPVVYPATHDWALGVYYDAQRIDQWPGGAYPGASPRMEGTSVLAVAKVCQARGFIPEYRWAFGVNQLIVAVGHQGPAVIGVPWYEGMVNPGPDGFLRRTGRVIGGHSVLVQGVSVESHSFLIHNSWGVDWGVGGQAWISFADMGKLLAARGEACIPVTRAA